MTVETAAWISGLGGIVCLGALLGPWRWIWVGWGLQTIGLALRWGITGNGPYLSRFEIDAAHAWALLGVALLLTYEVKAICNGGTIARPFRLLVLCGNLLLLGAAFQSPLTPVPLPATFRNPWLGVHVVAGKLAFGLLGTAAALGGAILLAGPRSATEVEGVVTRLLDLGSVTLFCMIGGGAVWASEAWGRYWGWDPVETWSLVAWLAYILQSHDRRRIWNERRTAWFAVAAFLMLCVVYFVVPAAGGGAHGAR